MDLEVPSILCDPVNSGNSMFSLYVRSWNGHIEYLILYLFLFAPEILEKKCLDVLHSCKFQILYIPEYIEMWLLACPGVAFFWKSIPAEGNYLSKQTLFQNF